MYSINTRGSTGNSLSAQLVMARDALLAHQNHMNTISHNVANVSTLGYHRQRTILGARQGNPGVNGMYGSGVGVLGIERSQVAFISNQERLDASLTGRWSTQYDSMMRVEEALNEISENGIGGALDAFWNSWEDLANDADSSALRTDVMNKAEDLGYAFASTYGNMDSQREQINVQMRGHVEGVNLIAGRIANLNQQIVSLSTSGQAPNDLLDQRELLLRDLATLVNINVEFDENGAANVYLGSEEIVHRDSNRELKWQEADDPSMGKGAGRVVWTDTKREVDISGGMIFGLQETRDKIGEILGELDSLADVIRDQVNGIHVEGIGLDGTTGNIFFRDDVSGARSLEVSNEIRENVDKIASSRVSPTGANDLAHEMFELQNATPFGNNLTINGKYQTMVSNIGSATQNAGLRLETAQAALVQTENLQQQYTGVSLDEEMSAMITAQYAFTAASKIFNAIDEMMDTVVKGLI
ncbi:MAG TPA: flagellar hook-associated protein FlgK [Bacteroidetes bacterium]|nr:flagellar hook-associated protein 1 [bacterium BMS3Bbin04]HDO64483.1 flagellar hook-associated protein FlgK [Bacteroidota bacterium]HEX03608.1 flagellar hook-associated protein FlgK [Bacteroidota bacterium]